MTQYDYSQPYVTRDEYLEVKGIDLNIELQDDDNRSNKVKRFITDLTNFVLDHLVMEYNCNELNRQTSNFEDLPEFRRKRFHYGMLDQIEYVLNNGLIQLDSGINRESGTITDFSSVTIGPAALKQFRLGAFCNKQERSAPSGDLSPREYTLGELVLALANKVDKVDGKGLSTNDFTNAYKMLIDSLNREINNKVDKEIGKVLSDNNFTNALLQKLLGIEAGAQVNKIEEIRINNEPVSITGKAVNLTAFEHDITKEDVANKVATISSESTDAQYPTAKCVYDNLQTVLEVALGSTKAFSVDPTTTGNTGFESGDATITVLSFTDVNGNVVDVTTLKKGDLVFTLNGVSTKYADRWLIDPATGAWGLIDADTPNLEGYAALSGNNTFTGQNTFSGGIKSETLSFESYLFINKRSASLFIIGQGSFQPFGDNLRDLGSLSNKFKEGFINKITDTKGSYDSDNTINSINATDITNNTLTDAQFTLITNGKDTHIVGTLRGVSNPILHYGGENNNFVWGIIQGSVGALDNAIGSFYITKVDKVIYVSSDTSGYLSLKGLAKLNGKTLDYYRNNVFPYASNATTELKYETINNITLSADTTYTLATAPNNTYPEYKANITNSGASDITITLPSGTVIKGNVSISSNTFVIPSGSTVEVNIQNKRALVVEW